MKFKNKVLDYRVIHELGENFVTSLKNLEIKKEAYCNNHDVGIYEGVRGRGLQLQGALGDELSLTKHPGAALLPRRSARCLYEYTLTLYISQSRRAVQRRSVNLWHAAAVIDFRAVSPLPACLSFEVTDETLFFFFFFFLPLPRSSGL